MAIAGCRQAGSKSVPAVLARAAVGGKWGASHEFPPPAGINGEVLMHLRARKKNSREVGLYDPIGVDREGNEISLLDVLGTDADIVPDTVELAVVMEWVRKFVLSLTRKERLVIDLRFGLNGHPRLTQRDIAVKLGISRSYVSRIEKRAVRKILQELSDGEAAQADKKK
ncbi:MAG: sigma factor-like helix-turn-helix DNA-binding protein [Thermaerobacter sp.]|nr:sigma factor-like helix-turn-helix DNA-binding protein [Thermaerobacter sp.]